MPRKSGKMQIAMRSESIFAFKCAHIPYKTIGQPSFFILSILYDPTQSLVENWYFTSLPGSQEYITAEEH
jgi:hypothetical protein